MLQQSDVAILEPQYLFLITPGLHRRASREIRRSIIVQQVDIFMHDLATDSIVGEVGEPSGSPALYALYRLQIATEARLVLVIVQFEAG